jgi:hypothetical protein
MTSRPPTTRTPRRPSLMFGLRAFFARSGTALPPPRSPTYPQLEPSLVALLVVLPPAGLFVWWRRNRQQR